MPDIAGFVSGVLLGGGVMPGIGGIAMPGIEPSGPAGFARGAGARRAIGFFAAGFLAVGFFAVGFFAAGFAGAFMVMPGMFMS